MANFSFNSIAISGLATAVPPGNITAESLSGNFTAGQAREIISVTGAGSFYRAQDLQTASDLGYEAANRLLHEKNIDTEAIGAIIFLSKTPDYRSPATAIVLHKRLGLSHDCTAFDVNMGSTGFVYGLQIGCSLLDSINKQYALIVMGDTSGRQVAGNDPAILSYGDGTSVLLLEKSENARPIRLATFADGSGFKSYILPGGAFRTNNLHESLADETIERNHEHLHINHNKMREFALTHIPQAITGFTEKYNTTVNDYDFIAVQQYEKAILEQIARHIGVNSLPSNIDRFGNTAGNSVPLLLTDTYGDKNGATMHVLAASFGEGFSWGIADFYIDTDNILAVIYTDEYFSDGNVTHEMSV